MGCPGGIYYTTPIELWQDFLEDSDKILLNVLNYCACQYDSLEEAHLEMGFSGGNWDKMKQSVASLDKAFCGVNFSISNKLETDKFFFLFS